jgi:CRISPR/Cas system CSM-associated protein Csm3 (group 7 of RAMP superfamily)
MKVTLIRANLAIDQRWAVGRVPSAAEEIHLPSVVDPRGGSRRPYVPATGLAGSLRRHLGDALAKDWLGPEPPDWEEREEAGRARERETGRLVLLGTFLNSTGDKARVEQRGVTSIDPKRRAANRGVLRTEEWNRPATVTVAMTHDGEADSAFLDALASWTPSVGRAASTGMGAARVELVEHLVIDLDADDQFTWWLNHRHSWLLRAETAAPPVEVPGARKGTGKPGKGEAWTICWSVREPLHIGVDDAATDAGPATGSQVQRTMTIDGKPVVPGSSWKGVVRARVGAILAVIDAPRRLDLLEYLFGSSRHGRGLLGFEDSVIEPSSIPNGKLQNRTHVAIDRFTGGARDGGLFVVQAIPAETPVTLTIRSEGPIPEPVRNLVRHVLWDMHEGLIGVGGMVTRGYGGLQFNTKSDSEPIDPPAPIDVSALLALLEASTSTETEAEEQ